MPALLNRSKTTAQRFRWRSLLPFPAQKVVIVVRTSLGPLRGSLVRIHRSETSLSLAQGMMGKGRRTGQARFQ